MFETVPLSTSYRKARFYGPRRCGGCQGPPKVEKGMLRENLRLGVGLESARRHIQNLVHSFNCCCKS
jgi:hypothetical protein